MAQTELDMYITQVNFLKDSLQYMDSESDRINTNATIDMYEGCIAEIQRDL